MKRYREHQHNSFNGHSIETNTMSKNLISMMLNKNRKNIAHISFQIIC